MKNLSPLQWRLLLILTFVTSLCLIFGFSMSLLACFMTERLRSKSSDTKSLDSEATEQRLARGNQKFKAEMPKPKMAYSLRPD
jgi:hypothetical protein